jgi:hypothetical protein
VKQMNWLKKAAENISVAVVFLLVVAFFYFLTIRPYVDCFSRPIPAGSNVGHIERCIFGVRTGFFDNKNIWHYTD